MTLNFGEWGVLLTRFDKANSTRGFWRDRAAGQWQLNIPFLFYLRVQNFALLK